MSPSEAAAEVARIRQKFATAFEYSDDGRLLRLFWSLNALQTGRSEYAQRHLPVFPPEAVMNGIVGGAAIYPWELETLANELLSHPKHRFYRDHNVETWDFGAALVNDLRALENAESAARRPDVNILVELGKVGARQFPWQRGHVGPAQFYRSSFIYGNGQCESYLQDSIGISVHDLTLVGFALFSVLNSQPSFRPKSDLQLLRDWGIPNHIVESALNRLSCSIDTIRELAMSSRDSSSATAYRPSVLRNFPCIYLGARRRDMFCPLPDLIIDRVTHGLFYDIAGGGWPVREEIGQRFEEYSFRLLAQSFPSHRFVREEKYITKLGEIASPDILMLDSAGNVTLAIECKASKMSVKAKFGENPIEDRGYEDIAKAIMQLWRFTSYSQSTPSARKSASKIRSLVLTLDEWFAARSETIKQVIERAHTLADESAHLIPHSARHQVAFCTISELEDVLRTATVDSLLETVDLASSEKVGWLFPTLHQDSSLRRNDATNYAFSSEMSDVIPWWGNLKELSAHAVN